MTVTPGHLTINGVPVAAASAYTAIAIIENTGTVPVRLATYPGDADDGRTIAPGATLEIEPKGRTIRVAADSPTSIAVTRYSLSDLREQAAEEFRIPIELLARKRSKDEIADFVIRYYNHEKAAE